MAADRWKQWTLAHGLALGLQAGAWAAALPTVTVSAPDAEASESGYFPALIRVERVGGDLAEPLEVALGWSGSAVAGRDYEPLAAVVVIPAGQSQVEFPVDPINDPDVEANPVDTLSVTLQQADGYTVGNPSSASVTITDNETYANTAVFAYAATADSASSITLHWTDNFENESKYRVQYRAEGTPAWTNIDVTPNSTSRRVTGLTHGQAYEFRVLAYAANGTTSSLTQNPLRQVVIDPGDAPAFSTFEQWRGATGLGGAARQIAGRSDDDPDGDGRINLLEYLSGTDPLAADRAAVSVSAGSTAVSIAWPDVPAGILDAAMSLEEAETPGDWQVSPLVATVDGGVRSVIDTRGGPARFYRLAATPAVPAEPNPLITCWGDSLTAYATGYPSRIATALGRAVQNCGIGGDTSIQIMERMRGLSIAAPYPAVSANTAAGTPVRIVAARTAHSRIMNASNRSSWATYAGTVANVTKVEFLNRGHKIGESVTPLSALANSNRASDASRILAPGHPFQHGHVVHFPVGPLPSPLVVGKTYYVRDVDADGFALVEDDNFVSITASAAAPNSVFTCSGHLFQNGDTVWFPVTPLPGPLIVGRGYHVRDAAAGSFSLSETPGGAAITMTSGLSGVVIKGPLRAPLRLNADFAGPTRIEGPFVLDWIHPGGATSLALRTHTDRDRNCSVFWMGRNNSSRPHEAYADIHAAVEHLKSINGRFLILGVLTASDETPTAASGKLPYYFNAINLNNLLRREYPNEFIDIRKELILRGQASGQDAIDRANDATPSSLRSDTLHLNDAGYQVVADVLAAAIQQRGW